MNCKSCNNTVESKFCSHCGQKVIENRLTVKSVLSLTVAKIFDLENSFWRTIKLLVKAPEKVINGYLSGATKRYYNPVRLVFIAVAVSLLSMSLTGFNDTQMHDLVVESNSEQVTDDAIAAQKGFMSFISRFIQLLSLILVPFFAFISWLLYKNKEQNFAEHIAINCYALGISTLIAIPFTVAGAFIDKYFFLSTAIGMFITIIYYTYVFKRLWKTNLYSAAIKSTMTVLIGYLLFIILIFVIGLIFMISTKTLG